MKPGLAKYVYGAVYTRVQIHVRFRVRFHAQFEYKPDREGSNSSSDTHHYVAPGKNEGFPRPRDDFVANKTNVVCYHN
jgi:hypothetical protein